MLNKTKLKILIFLIVIVVCCLIIRTIFQIIKYFFRSIWNLITGKRQNTDPLHSNDWLTRAQAKQEIRFQNSLPPLLSQAKPQKKTFAQRRNEKKGKSANGWSYNESTQLWEPPKRLKK